MRTPGSPGITLPPRQRGRLRPSLLGGLQGGTFPPGSIPVLCCCPLQGLDLLWVPVPPGKGTLKPSPRLSQERLAEFLRRGAGPAPVGVPGHRGAPGQRGPGPAVQGDPPSAPSLRCSVSFPPPSLDRLPPLLGFPTLDTSSSQGGRPRCSVGVLQSRAREGVTPPQTLRHLPCPSPASRCRGLRPSPLPSATTSASRASRSSAGR